MERYTCQMMIQDILLSEEDNIAVKKNGWTNFKPKGECQTVTINKIDDTIYFATYNDEKKWIFGYAMFESRIIMFWNDIKDKLIHCHAYGEDIDIPKLATLKFTSSADLIISKDFMNALDYIYPYTV